MELELEGLTRDPGVYLLRNAVSGRVYIGASVCVHRRVQDHVAALRTGRHHCKELQEDWDAQGPDVFQASVLETCSESQLLEREQKYMDVFRATDPRYGYNVVGAEGIRKHAHSTELREKLSKAMRRITDEDLELALQSYLGGRRGRTSSTSSGESTVGQDCTRL